MSHHFQVELTSSGSGIVVPFVGAFPNEEWALIEQFAECVESFGELPLVRDGLWGDLHLTFHAKMKDVRFVDSAGGKKSLHASGPISVDASRFPDREKLRTLLMFARPVLTGGHDVYFLDILDLFAARLRHPGWDELRERFDGTYSAQMFEAKFTNVKEGGELALVSGQTLYDWLMVNHYHPYGKDKKRAKRFEGIPETVLPADVITGIMLEILAEKLIAAFRLHEMVLGVRRGTGTVSFNPPPKTAAA